MRNNRNILNLIKPLQLFFLMSFLVCTITLKGYAESNESESSAGISISGFLWFDEDGSGILASEEKRIQEYPVSLYQYGNLSRPVETISTNSEGKYLFEDIAAGEYIIAIQQDECSEYIPSKIGIMNDNLFGCELNSLAAYTQVISLDENETKEEINCAMIRNEIGEVETESYQEESEQETLCEEKSGISSSEKENNPALDADTSSFAITDRFLLPEETQTETDDSSMRMRSATGIFSVYEGDGKTLIALKDTLDAAVAACEGDSYSTYEIRVSADVPDMGPCVTIPEGKNITITSEGTNIYKLTQIALNRGEKDTSARHLCVYGGTLVLKNIILEGTFVESSTLMGGGGVWVRNGGSLYIEDGAVITGCYSAGSGAGVYLDSSSKGIINGGQISGNYSSGDGGGIYCDTNTTLTMHGGMISRNVAAKNGGGVSSSGVFTIKNGTIDTNEAQYGGGIYAYVGGYINMEDGSISKNTASANGGGIYVSTTHVAKAEFVMAGGSITGNSAIEGGGIYTSDKLYNENPTPALCYRNIGIGSTAIVSSNTASQIYFPPSSYQYFQVRANNPFNGLLLDNYNINYVYDNSLSYGILYIANHKEKEEHHFQITLSGDWEVPLEVLSLSDTGFKAEENFRFVKWNTQPDGKGEDWKSGEVYKSTRSRLTLYAIWERVSYSITEKFVDMDGKAVDSELYKDRKATVDIANSSYSFSENAESLMLGRISNSSGNRYDYAGYYISDAEFDSKAVLTEGIPEISNVAADTNVYIVYRPAIDNFTFFKIDGLSGNTLEGAVFELYEWDSENDYDPESGFMAGDSGGFWLHKDTQISAVNGKVTFENLASGKYMLVEKEAPLGYLLPYGQWLLDTTVNPIKITAVSKNAASPPPLFKTSEAEDKTQGELLLPNYKSMVMPATGGIGNIISTVAGIALVGIGIIFILFSFNQNRKFKSYPG